MTPCKDISGGEDSKGSRRLVVVGAIDDKGKGVAKTEGEDQAGGYNGKISPPHVAAAAREGRSSGHRGDKELHITTERERRKRMSKMFNELRSLLPTLPDKVDKSSIVMETIHYIKSLEGTLMEVEKRKQEMQLARGKVGATTNNGISSSAMAITPTTLVAQAPAPPITVGTVAPAPVGIQMWLGHNVVLCLSGNDAWINVCVARRLGMLTMVMTMLEKHNIDDKDLPNKEGKKGVSSSAAAAASINGGVSGNDGNENGPSATDSDNNNHNAPPATSSDSMSPGKNDNGNDESKSSSHPVIVSSIDKGKSVIKIEGEDEGGRSKGKINTPHVIAAARHGRSRGRHGDRELHIITERERRKRMSEMFTKLHGLLPTLPDKVDKSSIVMEAIHYIKSLEETLSELEKQKLEMQLARGKIGAATNDGVSSSAVALALTDQGAPMPVALPVAGIGPTGAVPTPPITVGAVTAAPAGGATDVVWA
ncbi:hypothetical protein QYE76_022876 [Lolium multiflorum]|uniref:BHLH domain-containing protein n=1 Tax=Lolium multiflorum TaxID=4521 RepID=A0AAD8VS95_LOLMU|nr:hypothetical protein QYE76_022876 [Lolium multiflorum]